MRFLVDFVNLVNYKVCMTDKQKYTENEAQIIRSIYMRDDHCDWGSSGMNDLAETTNESN